MWAKRRLTAGAERATPWRRGMRGQLGSGRWLRGGLSFFSLLLLLLRGGLGGAFAWVLS